MIPLATVLVFSVSAVLSLPIVFASAPPASPASGSAAIRCSNRLVAVAASQSWVLLAIPSFVFAGSTDGAGRHVALPGGTCPRALVGWLRGGLGMSVIVVSYFFSDICGSKMAEVSALSSALMPPLAKAGYRPEDACVVDRGGHRDGHAGTAGDLHDRHQRRHQPVGGGAVPGGLHSRRRSSGSACAFWC